MKTFLFLSSTALLSLALTSCGRDNSGPPAASAETPYPLDVCVVSGEKLGSMGEPVIVTREGVTVKFCCDHCLPEFEKDPTKFIAKIKEATTE